MKIWHVITTIESGGAENQLLILAKMQVEQGNQVMVSYLKGKPELREHFEKYGIRVEKSLAKKPWLVQIFLKKCIKFKADVIHLHLPRTELIFALFPLTIPMVCSRHNAERFLSIFGGKTKLLKGLSSAISRIVTARFEKVIAISNAVKDFLISNSEVSDSNKIIVNYYGISLELPKYGLHNENSIITIGTISRLVPQKNIEVLLSAFYQISKEFKNIKLEIIGDGYLKNMLVEKTRIFDINKKVLFHGKIVDPWKTASRWNIFILTSKYEGFGLVLLESMKFGVPIIVSDSLAAVEVMGVDYPFFFKTGDSNDLQRTFKRIMNSKFNFESYYYRRLNLFSILKSELNHEKIYASAIKKCI